MWGRVKVTIPPAALPLTAAGLRMRLRVMATGDDTDDAADETLLDDMCAAAVAEVDGPDGIGVAMMRQTWALSLDSFAPMVNLPGAPIVGVVSVRYLDAAEVWQVLDVARYRVALGSDPARIVPVGDGWPAVASGPDVIEILYTLGAEDAALVDQGLITAVAMLAAHYWENREAVVVGGGGAVEVPMGVQRALNRHRRGRVAG